MSKTPEHNAQAPAPQHEDTPEGVQTLVPGVAPVTLRERLEVMARQPMTPKRGPILQKPCDIGLFDEAARAQLDLIDALRSPEDGQSTQPTPTEKE